MIVPRSVSPILDGYTLSAPTSAHDAAVCAPATENLGGAPYVVKVIGVPASGVRIDALLMAGAFPDRDSVNDYYKEQAREIRNEAKRLRNLATLGYFADFDSVQVVPAEQENGYEVYLLAPRRTSVRRILSRKDVTQLEIVNMALDVCAALSTCRQAGFFYANLKPENVFHVGGHYRIGDLGFLPTSAVGRTVLPPQYRNSYTPPELRKGNLPLNDTADIYALGMMLYEVYNGGALPQAQDIVGQLLAPPKYADYEMAEIILRACAPDPSIRWHDPQQMGQALSRYVQRNGLHDSAVLPSVTEPAPSAHSAVEAEIEEAFLPEEYDETDFSEDLWPSVEAPAQPPRKRAAEAARKPSRRRIAVIAVIFVLTAMLLVELVIGVFLLIRRSQAKPEALAMPAAQCATLGGDRPLLSEEETQIGRNI